jgi:hypothetical protein
VLRSLSVVAALSVFAIGFAVVWINLTPVDPVNFCPLPRDETGSFHTEPQLWPPGTIRCEYSDEPSRTYVPWREWLALACLAAAFGFAAARRFVVAAVLVAASFAAFFV